ncbi:Phosphatidylinositol 4-phosphate 3-kinase C2 domain-containing subunit alpha [Taenia crassiceps]|uniref:phosphatidylinositol-4-phosphate 3-kinase n=1 Tax=Taenia crassiceps TaxID=6207 RepID=A0ABR4QFX8_9CEST
MASFAKYLMKPIIRRSQGHLMSSYSDDLIAFTDSENVRVDSPKTSVLAEFDPLFDLKGKERAFSQTLRQPPRRTLQSERSTKSNQSADQHYQNFNHRLGGIFDKDAIWCELEEFALSDPAVNKATLSHSLTLPNLTIHKSPSTPDATPQQQSPGSLPLHANLAIDTSLLNFAKAVENCTPWLPGTKDTFPTPSSTRLQRLPTLHPPVSFNAYIFDAILGTIADRAPQTAFIATPGPDGLDNVSLKIYIPMAAYFCNRYTDSMRNWLAEKFQTACEPTKAVSTLVKECLERAYGTENPFKSFEYCLRICGRTDLLHPHARLCDHEYIRDCCRTGAIARLVLEPFSAQEYFLPSPEDKALKLNLHEAYAGETRIPDRAMIENSVMKISGYIANLRKQVSNLSFNTINAAGHTCEMIRKAVVEHISGICHGTTINTLPEAMAAVQNSLYNLMLSRKPRKQTIFHPNPPSPRDRTGANEEELVMEKLTVLEMQVIRQTIAFLKWKQAWYPELRMATVISIPSLGSEMECERLLGCHMLVNRESHRISKCDMPFIMRIGSVIDPTDHTDPWNLSERIGVGSCVRVHVILTYAGRPLSTVYSSPISPAYPKSVKGCAEYACTTPVLRDFHYSRKADFNSGGKIDEWIRFLDFPFRRLPRETLLNVSLIALKKQTEDPAILSNGTLLGWVNVPIFDGNGRLRQEVVLAGLWPPVAEGLSPEFRSTFAEPNRSHTAVVVELEFPIYPTDFIFSKPQTTDDLDACQAGISDAERRHYNELASQILYTPASQLPPVGRRLTETIGEPKFTTFLADLSPHQLFIDQLWQHRHRLVASPELLTTLVVAAPVCWPGACRSTSQPTTKNDHDKILWMFLLSQLYSLIQVTSPISPAAALRLLLPDVPDQFVRNWAVCCLSRSPPDGLICYLPCLLEAVNYDLHLDWSGIVSLLLHRSTVSLRFCNALYWNIESALMNPKWYSQRRLFLLKTAMIWLHGSRLKATWSLQADVLSRIRQTAEAVKAAKDKMKSRTLQEGLDSIQTFLDSRFKSKDSEEIVSTSANGCSPLSPNVSDLPTPDAFRLPYDFGFACRSFKTEACTYITSFTCPIRLTLNGIDGEMRKCIFKVGDDLQMDLLICQLIHVADRIWLNGGMDLCVPHFTVMPMEPKRGLIEPVPNSETLRLINQNSASNPRFKRDQGLLMWLRENHLDTEALRKAVDNFFHSTVAGSVLTFVLGLGDRHNDNIMMRDNGQSFHIDFAKVFGNFQKILSFNRDRSPFILTPDMVEVVKFAEPPASTSSRREDMPKELVDIPSFVRHCCQAYNLLRKYTFSIMSLMEMAWQMQLPGLERGQIGHVYGNLRRSISDAEAETFFKELIQRSIQSYTAQLNNMIHDKVQRSKKQPSTAENPEGRYAHCTAQGVYLHLQSNRFSSTSNTQPEIGLAKISVTDTSLTRNGWYSKPAFKFEIQPEAKNPLGTDGEGVRGGFSIVRDAQELKRLVWRLLDSNPKSRPAMNLLNQLSELDDQVVNCAQPSPPSAMLLNSLTMGLVELIQFHALDPNMINFWKPTEADLRPELPQRSTSVASTQCSSGSSSSPQSQSNRNSTEADENPPPDRTAVLLTLELSASCDRLSVCVEEGREWWLPDDNLTMNAMIDIRGIPNSVRVFPRQHYCILPSNNPKLNETFTIEFQSNEYKDAILIFTARQIDTLGSKKLIGDVVIPLSSLAKLQSSPSTLVKVTRWYELSRRKFERV